MADLITLTGNVVDHLATASDTIPLEGVTVTATPSREVTTTSDGSDATTDAATTSDENGDYSLPLVHATGLQYRITYRVGGRVIHRGTLACDSWAAGSTVTIAELPPIAGVPPSAVEDLQAWVLAYVASLDVDPAVIEQAVLDYLAVNPVGIPDHNDTTGRDAADAHPMSAITGLVSALAGKQAAGSYATTGDLSGHASDTTGVHGIADTANLVLTDDARLSDARTPTAHATSHASGGSDPVTPASIGAATPSQVSSGDSATLAAAQSHAQGLVDALTAASPATLDTLAEIADALGEDPNFAATMTTALANRVRVDAAQSLTVGEQARARSNIGAGTSSFSGAYGDLSDKPTLGTAAATASTDYATAAQGAKADTALQVATAQPINAQTGAYTLVASDAGKLVTLTLTAAADLTVPANVFTAGQRVDIADRGTARATVLAGSGMTVNPPAGGSLVMEGRYAYASLVFISATEADLVGLVAAS